MALLGRAVQRHLPSLVACVGVEAKLKELLQDRRAAPERSVVQQGLAVLRPRVKIGASAEQGTQRGHTALQGGVK